MHVRQIAEYLHQQDSSYSVEEWKERLQPGFAELKKTGAIVKTSIGGSNINTFWGSKNWVDAKGNPKPEHKFDIDQIRKGSSEQVEI